MPNVFTKGSTQSEISVASKLGNMLSKYPRVSKEEGKKIHTSIGLLLSIGSIPLLYFLLFQNWSLLCEEMKSVVLRAVIGCSQDLFLMEKTEYSRKQLSEGEEQHVLSQALKTSRPAVELTGSYTATYSIYICMFCKWQKIAQSNNQWFFYFMYQTLPIYFHKLLPTLLIP